MAQQTVNNGDTGLASRTKINENFTELYTGKGDAAITYKTETDSHTMDADDLTDLAFGKFIVFLLSKSSASTFTLPQNSDLAVPVGAKFLVRRTHATGVVTYAAGTGATVTSSAGGLTDPGLNTDVQIEKTATNTWFLSNGSPGTMLTWVPTFTGFSANPAIVNARYCVIGKMCFVNIVMGDGTSNATSFTITFPLAPANGQLLPCIIRNNNVDGTGRLDLSAGTNIVTVRSSLAAGAWTASGNKNLEGCFVYEVL